MVNVNCTRCTGTTRAGDQCRRRTCRGNLCWTHLKREKSLRVKTVPGMGLGLFTTRARFQGNLADVIILYTGEHLTGQQKRTLYPADEPQPQYLLCNNKETHRIDAKRVTSSFARFINRDEQNANVEFVRYSRGPPPHFTMRASKYIPAGAQMFANYGPEFDHLD